ncbi:N-acyl-D-amino-acid deacylase family protein [Nocardia terpenica]|uniref:Amidohydrolase family protein n=1 Tax=Nocardia terpenica TaxID=455432 RepID=A0A6G9Z733_9NOCA|nr:amidohydrolase family protein [Nocardia terpenica]QIS21409.1 amidohydrolase family protein [Nocardia terpenica]
MDRFDLVIRNGLWFDGTGAQPKVCDLGIRDGEVAAVEPTLPTTVRATQTLNAAGKWVLPGFIDVHTHYDVEMLARPALTESLRHGVTTAVIGNCSLTTILAGNDECADIFSRVEAVPRDAVVGVLGQHRTWSSPTEYAKVVDALPLGLNIAAFLGHSDLRIHVMGMDRAVDATQRPTTGELARMRALLTEALDAGFLGLSSTTNLIDKVDGDRYRSRALPSTFVRRREFRALNEVLRQRGRILQSTPRISLNPNLLQFFLASSGRFGRRQLKVSLLSAADSKAYPPVVYLMLYGAPALNRLLNGAFQWQHLPVPFTVYADGIDLVVFEEFGSGSAALDIKDHLERNRLLDTPEYRRWFRRDYRNKLAPKIWHRDLYDAVIVECPDISLVAKSFGQIADERGIHPVDAFLDLVIGYDTDIRWRTTVANHRPRYLDKLAANKHVHMGFGDAGAHLRNMAFYNYHLRLLRRVVAAERAGKPFLTLPHAIHRLTGELGDWYQLDAGHLRRGDRADIVIIDPEGLDHSVDALTEEPIAEYGGLRRMVNRNDNAVTATIVNGRIAYHEGRFATDLGTTWGPGRYLPAHRKIRTTLSTRLAPLDDSVWVVGDTTQRPCDRP